MNIKKIVSCLAAGIVLCIPLLSQNTVLAESSAAEENYTEGTYTDTLFTLKYKKYNDHIEITSGEYNSDRNDIIEYPAEIEGLPVTCIAYAGDSIWGQIVIPDSVTKIGQRAFYNNYNITSVSIPDSVVEIGTQAFASCDLLESITIPARVEVLSEVMNPFYACDNLKEINVSPDNKNYVSADGVLFNADKTRLISYSIGKKDAFYTIPDGVKHIGEYAFAYSENLTDFTVPESLGYVGEKAFNGSIWYENQPFGEMIYIGKALYSYKLENVEDSPSEIIIKDGTLSICDSVFENNNVITSVTLPEGIKSIGRNAFGGCENLNSINLPDSINYIGRSAFSYTNLEYVKIPESLEETNAFSFCTNNTDMVVWIPSSLKYIETNTFNSELTIYYSGTPEEWEDVYKGTYNPGLSSDNVNVLGGTGDVNTDGSVDTKDSSLVLECYAKQASGIEFNFSEDSILNSILTSLADVNEDGEVNITDASLILMYYAQKGAGNEVSWEDIIQQ